MTSIFRLSRFVVIVILFLSFVGKGNVGAQGGYGTVPSSHWGINYATGDFDYFQATFKAPSADAVLPLSSGACLNHPVWIKYPNGGWVEVGISKCPTDPPNKYHLYGFALGRVGGPHEWMPFTGNENLISLNQTVDIRMQKHPTDGSKWQIYVNGVLKWEPSFPEFNQSTSRIDLGIEAQSPMYRGSPTYLEWIWVRKTGWDFPILWPWWNYNSGSEWPERYYVRKLSGSTYRQYSYGYGLPSRTGWGGPNTLGLGQRIRGKTLPWPNGLRDAETYSGISGIDAINWKTTANGEQAIFAMGWHNMDRAEYLMEIPTNPFTLCIIAISDRPGPVLMNIYVDGSIVGQMSWAENDNNRHVWCQPFNISNLKVPHVHAIGIEFANDYYYYPGYYDPDQDRNFYVDMLGITQ